MNRENTLDLIKKAFDHFIIEENVEIDDVPAYLYIPTLQTIVTSEEVHVDSYLQVVVKEEQNDAGKIINDILLGREFVPMFDAE